MKMITFAMILGVLFLSVVVTSAQTQNFSGNWKINNEKTKSGLKSVIVGMNVSQTATELKIEHLSLRDGVPESKTDVYNLDGTGTISRIENELERSTFTRAIAFQGSNKLQLSVNRLLNGGDGIITTLHDDIWELMDNGKTLKVTSYLGLSDMKNKTNRQPVSLELYFTRE